MKGPVMNHLKGRPARLAFVAGVVLVGAVIPCGCAGRDRYYTSTPESGVSRVVQRPSYEEPGARPFSIGGYAGADYSRASRGRP
jgi:hypothetical protein